MRCEKMKNLRLKTYNLKLKNRFWIITLRQACGEQGRTAQDCNQNDVF